MATKDALDKAVAAKIKEYTKIAKAETAAGRELSEGFRSLKEIQERARQVVMSEMSAMISAHFTSTSGKEVDDTGPDVERRQKSKTPTEPGSTAGAASAGPDVGGAAPGIEEYGIGTEEDGSEGGWKKLNGMDAKKIQDMVHRFEFEEYTKDKNFEEWQRACLSRIKTDLKILGFIFDSGSPEIQILEQYASHFSVSGICEEARDFVISEFYDEDFLIGQMIDGGIYAAIQKSITKLQDRKKIIGEHDGLLRRSQTDGQSTEFSGLVLFSVIRKHTQATTDVISEKAAKIIMDQNDRSYYPNNIKFVESHFEIFSKAVDDNDLYSEAVCSYEYVKSMHKLFPNTRFLYLGKVFADFLVEITNAGQKDKNVVSFLRISSAVSTAMVAHRTYTPHLFSNVELGDVERHSKPQGFTRDPLKKGPRVQAGADAGAKNPKGGKGKGKDGHRRPDNATTSSAQKKFCFAFQKGKCEHGKSCRFAHEYEKPQGVASQNVSEKRPCIFFPKGTCKNGRKCKFLHVAKPAGEQNVSNFAEWRSDAGEVWVRQAAQVGVPATPAAPPPPPAPSPAALAQVLLNSPYAINLISQELSSIFNAHEFNNHCVLDTVVSNDMSIDQLVDEIFNVESSKLETAIPENSGGIDEIDSIFDDIFKCTSCNTAGGSADDWRTVRRRRASQGANQLHAPTEHQHEEPLMHLANRFECLQQENFLKLSSHFSKIEVADSFLFPKQVKLALPKPPKPRKGKKSKSLKNIEIGENKVEIPKASENKVEIPNGEATAEIPKTKNYQNAADEGEEDDEDLLVDTGANMSNFHSKRRGNSVKMKCLIRTVGGLITSSEGKRVQLAKGLWLTGTVNNKGPELIAACELSNMLQCDLVISGFQAYFRSQTGHRIYLKVKNGLPYLDGKTIQELEDHSHFCVEYADGEVHHQHPLNRIVLGNKSKISENRKNKNLKKLGSEISDVLSGTDTEILKKLKKLDDGVLKLGSDVFQSIGKIRHRQSRRKKNKESHSFHLNFQKQLNLYGEDYFSSISSDTGKFHSASLFHNLYFTIFIEHCSKKPYVGFKNKNSAEETLENFKDCFPKRLANRMLHFHSDGGTEFLGKMQQHLKREMGLAVSCSNPYQPAENGVAEKCIGLFKQESSILLSTSGLPYFMIEQAMVHCSQKQREKLDSFEPVLFFEFGQLCVYRASPVQDSRGRLGIYLHLAEDALPSLQHTSHMLLDFRSLKEGVLKFIRSDHCVDAHVNMDSSRHILENIFSTVDFGIKKKKRNDDDEDFGDGQKELAPRIQFGDYENTDELYHPPPVNVELEEFNAGLDDKIESDPNADIDFAMLDSDDEDEKVDRNEDEKVAETDVKTIENLLGIDLGNAERSPERIVEFDDEVPSADIENKSEHSDGGLAQSPENNNKDDFAKLIARFQTDSPPKQPADVEKSNSQVAAQPSHFPDRGLGREAQFAEVVEPVRIFDINGLANIMAGSEFSWCQYLDYPEETAQFKQSSQEYFKSLNRYLEVELCMFEHEVLTKRDPRYSCGPMSEARFAEWNNFITFSAIGREYHISQLSEAQLKRVIFPVEVSSIKFGGTDAAKYKHRITANGRNVPQNLFTTINVMEHSSRRILNFYAARLGLQIGVADARSGYLQADELENPYFMHLPGWMKKGKNTLVEILRPIYGLPDSGRFFQLFVEKILYKLGFRQYSSFKSLFWRKINGKFEMVGTYVDDFWMVSSDILGLHSEIVEGGLLLQPPEILNYKNAVNFNGIDIIFEEKNGIKYIVEDMNRYTRKIIENYSAMTNKSVFRSTHTPGQNREAYIFNEPSDMLNTNDNYDPHTILAQCLYLARGVRPDISNAVSFLSRQVHAWSTGADLALEKLVGYLYTYPTGKLRFKLPPPDFKIGFENILYFSDADLGGDLTTNRSTGGDLTFLSWGDSPDEKWLLSWTSKMLSHKATSTPWSEMAALQRGLQSCALPSSHLCELITTCECPIRAKQDNAAVIQALSLGYSLQMRYLARHSRLSITNLHSLFASDANCISYVESGKNTSDLMTKSLDANLHWFHVIALGMVFEKEKR